MSIEKRIDIARKAIMLLRKDKRIWDHNSKSKWPLTFGFYGLLDYIEFGKPENIMEGQIRNAVEYIIALQASNQKETE